MYESGLVSLYTLAGDDRSFCRRVKSLNKLLIKLHDCILLRIDDVAGKVVTLIESAVR